MRYHFRSALLVIVTGWVLLPEVSDAQVIEKSADARFESETLVRKGDAQVTLADFSAYLNWQVPEEDQIALIANPARMERILENIALTEGFRSLAQEQGLLDGTVNQARLYQAISREIRSIYREWYRSDTELESYEAQARELYLVEPQLFEGPVTYDVEHLLIPVDSNEGSVRAMRDILEAYEKVLDGAVFVEVIDEYSTEASASSNGLLEGIDASDLVPSVAAAIEANEVGELSLPVQSSFGWHLVKVIAVNPPEQLSWEEARPRAEALARERHLVESFERILREINARPMQFADGAVQRILDYYGLDGFGINAVSEESDDIDQETSQ